jgi:hypothetical protein
MIASFEEHRAFRADGDYAHTPCQTHDAPFSTPWRGRSCATIARSGALPQQLALACVARERCRAFELRAGFVEAAGLGEGVAAPPTPFEPLASAELHAMVRTYCG